MTREQWGRDRREAPKSEGGGTTRENGHRFVERRDYDIETGRFHTRLARFDGAAPNLDSDIVVLLAQ